jgi:hypothetical protein
MTATVSSWALSASDRAIDSLRTYLREEGVPMSIHPMPLPMAEGVY